MTSPTTLTYPKQYFDHEKRDFSKKLVIVVVIFHHSIMIVRPIVFLSKDGLVPSKISPFPGKALCFSSFKDLSEDGFSPGRHAGLTGKISKIK